MISHLSLLADEDIEALRILQTIIVMMTTSHVIQKESLAQVTFSDVETLKHTYLTY